MFVLHGTTVSLIAKQDDDRLESCQASRWSRRRRRSCLVATGCARFGTSNVQVRTTCSILGACVHSKRYSS
jgi:hypothetical protein